MSLSSYALTTLADAKTHMRITSSADDAFITELINAATNRMERLCGRNFAARDYRQRFNGTDKGSIVAQHWPIISVNRIASGAANAMSATYTGSDVRAMLLCTPSAVITRSLPGTGTYTSNTFTFELFPLVSDLAVGVNALTGWDAASIANGPAADVNPIAGTDALGRTIYLTYPDEDQTDALVAFEEGIISLNTDRVSGMGTSGAFARGFRNWLIEYRAGYESASTSSDTSDLSQLCRELVATAYQRRGLNLNVKSESLADYSYTLMSGVELSMDQSRTLALWSRARVASLC